MKKIVSVIILLLSIVTSFAQISWGEPTLKSMGGSEYLLTIDATIDDGWHIYDTQEYKDGPNPTRFDFEESQGVELLGAVTTSQDPVRLWDDIFEMEIGYYKDSVTFEQRLTLEDPSSSLKFSVEWMLCSADSCTPPAEQSFEVMAETEDGATSSIWWSILEAMLWGFAAILTPCVFPMVPMTISYFLKGSQNALTSRLNVLIYGVLIVVLYTLPIAAMITLTYLFGGGVVTADIFNWMATHWLPNVIFFVVFIIFAASFLGAFEITLPSKWVNMSDSRAGKSSFVGLLFLALTLVLVSFSCTVPIVGTVLISSTRGDFWMPIITMLAFSSAFALPFVLCALFPSMLKSMPKSGGWLASVKVVLGFVEIALALKFLSVADQSYGWGILPREIYLAVWIVVFTLMGLYLLGKLRIKGGGEPAGIGVGRLFLAMITFAFVVYILPGMWGAPLTPLAGYLPPLESKSFNQVKDVDSPKTKNLEFSQAQQLANEENKPLLIYFTGHGCVNCREMEQRVWSDERVSQILKHDYVVVALYVDERRELPSSQWVTTEQGSVLKSVGRVNSYLATSRY
ncbi:MAG: cytochrome c biogenesis protein CcdA, partial [Rikenellaceae bacterium]